MATRREVLAAAGGLAITSLSGIAGAAGGRAGKTSLAPWAPYAGTLAIDGASGTNLVYLAKGDPAVAA
ncbi:MAG TPA: hypothetical protein VHL61_10100, partial [Luteimonas sp.]|nr:hypothetical protein [Luteimonas sp.]